MLKVTGIWYQNFWNIELQKCKVGEKK